MTRFQIGTRSLALEAHLVLPAAASDAASWAGGRWVTVKLSALLEALRVHTSGRAFLAQGRPASTEARRWLLIDDVIRASSRVDCAGFHSVIGFLGIRSEDLSVGRTQACSSNIGGLW